MQTHIMLPSLLNYSDITIKVSELTCKRPSKLRGMVTQPVGVAPFDVIAFSNSCSPPN